MAKKPPAAKSSRRARSKPERGVNGAADSSMLPLPADGEIGSVSYFMDEIEASEDRLRDEVKEWKKDLARYDGERVKLEGVAKSDTVNVNAGYYTVEQKKPQLVFQTPFVQVASKSPTVTERAAKVFQAVLNERLGRDFIDAETLLDEILHDNLVVAGHSATKIGYEVVKKIVQQPTGRMEPDPLGGINPETGAPVMRLALGEDGKPETQDVPVPIWSEYYWNRFSPSDLRLPKGFTAMHKVDTAPWVAWRFSTALEVDGERRRTAGGGLDGELSLLSSKDRDALDKAGSAFEIFYRAHLFDDTEVNPEKIRQLILIPPQGRGRGRTDTRVLVHRDCPYQRFDPVTGEFLAGMKGYPIHILTHRVKPDAYSPRSDARVIRDAADEKSMGRTLMVQQRKRNLPLRGFDKTRVAAEDVERIRRGDVQHLIPFDGPPHEALAAIDKSAFPTENFEFDRIAQQDIDRLAASGANQQSQTAENVITATEAGIIARASETQQAKQRNRLLGCWLSGVEKLGSLIQLYADEKEIVKYTDAQGKDAYFEWDKSVIQGRFAFDLKPDSSVRTNAAEERAEFMKLFTNLANYEGANRQELFRVLIRKWNEDPDKLALPEIPKKDPEKPKVNIALKGDDLDPLAPQYKNVLVLLQLVGVGGLSPAPPDTLNAARPVEPVDKHTADLSGQRPGPSTPGQSSAVQ